MTPGGGDSASGRRGDAASRSSARTGQGAGHGGGAKRGGGTGGTGRGSRGAGHQADGAKPDDRTQPEPPETQTPAEGRNQRDSKRDKTPADAKAGQAGHADQAARSERPRMPPVRLAPRDELAAAARVAPLLRAAADLSRWADTADPAGQAGQADQADPPGHAARTTRFTGDALTPADALAAAAALELTPAEVEAAWRVVVATGLRDADGDQGAARLDQQDASGVLSSWDAALAAILDAEELDGLATALYTVGAPVRIDALFEAYTAAAGTALAAPDGLDPAVANPQSRARQPDEAAALSGALETLADLGVVELGTEENAGGLTVALSPLGVWGVHRRLRGQGWHVPVLGSAGRDGAVGLLMTLASCDAEDGEAEIGTWLAGRSGAQAARELIQAASAGSPGLRGAAFAVLDRIGDAATPEIRAALADPLLRAHAAVWLHEHDEEAELRPQDRTWLLVDLGAGLLEEADPLDVVAELLPEVPAQAQADIVAGLWRVDHPGVIDLLTALSEYHPDPGVARAARKAAFKARSPGSAGSARRDS
ncbi:MAG TPA: hypothetical protein VHU92_24125 [Streptosporangiaceae bacterium]|nr:hypothetical protein [Streptosporangiaceae bacterium]